MEAITQIECTWREFILLNDSKNPDFVYRGQTNEYQDGKFIEWDLISSFNRYYTDQNYNFVLFLGQQLEKNIFNSFYSNYKCIKDSGLTDSDTLTKLYFLQHYGVPTCLIDFTYNPLIAIYFAISNIRGRFILKGNKNYPEDCFISVFKINIRLLSEILKIKEIEHFNNDLFVYYENYEKSFNYNSNSVFIALDLHPKLRIENKYKNYNLSKQDSCFILFDNCEANNISIDQFVQLYINENNILLDKPIIVKYKIPYNDIFRKPRTNDLENISLFKYLSMKKISGGDLFNDFQGLKYDFNFFNQM